jgi:hypothetical protein
VAVSLNHRLHHTLVLLHIQLDGQHPVFQAMNALEPLSITNFEESGGALNFEIQI